MSKFIKEHRAEIDLCIKTHCPSLIGPRGLNDDVRRDWLRISDGSGCKKCTPCVLRISDGSGCKKCTPCVLRKEKQ